MQFGALGEDASPNKNVDEEAGGDAEPEARRKDVRRERLMLGGGERQRGRTNAGGED